MINYVISENMRSEIEANSFEEAKVIIKELLKDQKSYFTLPPALTIYPDTGKFINQKSNFMYSLISYEEYASKKSKSTRKSNLK